jgi:hypothetical protein
MTSEAVPDLQVIDWFREYRYEQKADVTVEFARCDGYTPYLGDYRTRDQVVAEAAAQRQN